MPEELWRICEHFHTSACCASHSQQLQNTLGTLQIRNAAGHSSPDRAAHSGSLLTRHWGHELAQFSQVHYGKLLQLLPIRKCWLQIKETKVLCTSVRAVRHIQVHISVLWGDVIPYRHYVLWLLWENSACVWRTCKIPSRCLNSWDAGKAAMTHRMYSSTSLGSGVKPDVHIQRNNIWDDWTDWVGGQLGTLREEHA